jgi:hypothetical protein
MKKILIFIGCVLIINISAQTNLAKQQAMYIYNFTKLIDYPDENKSDNFIIGIVGASSTFEDIKSLFSGKTLGNGQKFIIQKFKSVTEITNCHILFITYTNSKELTNILTKVQNSNTLIITEQSGAINKGSAINFVVINEKLKFELKTENAINHQVKVSSKLNELSYEQSLN